MLMHSLAVTQWDLVVPFRDAPYTIMLVPHTALIGANSSEELLVCRYTP